MSCFNTCLGCETKSWTVKGRPRAVLAQPVATVVPAPVGECNPMTIAVAPGGTTVGEGTVVEEEGVGVVGDRGKMTDEEVDEVVEVMGVVIQEWWGAIVLPP